MRFDLGYWWVVGLCVAFYATIFPFRTFANLYFIEAKGLSPEAAGNLKSILPLLSMIGMPLFGLLADRIGKRALLMAAGSALLVPPFFLLIGTSISPTILMGMLGLAFALVPAVLWPAVTYLVPEARLGSAYALMTFCQQVGWAGMSWGLGLLKDGSHASAAHPAGLEPGHDRAGVACDARLRLLVPPLAKRAGTEEPRPRGGDADVRGGRAREGDQPELSGAGGAPSDAFKHGRCPKDGRQGILPPELRGGVTTGSGSPPLLMDRRSDSIRRQESGLILLNLSILGGIALVHALFGPVFGRPPRVFYVALLGRWLMQSVELILLQRGRESIAERTIVGYAHVSIWLNLGFAFALSRLSSVQDSHYSVLMVIPVVAAAFRYRPPGIVLVVSAAAAATFLEVWLDTERFQGVLPTEYFEAAGVALIYLVVGLVVAYLARQVRSEQLLAEENLAELHRTKDRLVEEEKLAAVGRLASAIAHEVRNPVTMIVSSLALARRGGAGSLPREELDEILTKEAERLERLTTDFLSYARARPPERTGCDVHSTLRYIADVTQARSLEKGVRVRVDAPEGLHASLDAFQIHQALLNLVVNGLEAAPPGSEIVLGARPGGLESGSTGVVLTVEDSGGGVPADQRQRIFEPFFTTRASGSGLGLAIAQRIARAHGGEVVLEANEPGRVRFALALPEVPAPTAARTESPCIARTTS